MSSPQPPETASLPVHMTAAEVAPHLRMTAYQVGELCKSGKIRATKPGRSWLIEPQAVRDYLDAHANSYKAAS